MAQGVLKQMKVSQQIVETDAMADNGQRGHQREKSQPFTNGRMTASFCMRGAPVQSGRSGHQKVRATVSCSDDRHNGLPSLC
ncbi:hypothetical protein LNO36_11785 [Klebsiella variicola subsp. variicola]|nr:hypothetical protein [Klebsiella variicola subsp. variicola]